MLRHVDPAFWGLRRAPCVLSRRVANKGRIRLTAAVLRMLCAAALYANPTRRHPIVLLSMFRQREPRSLSERGGSSPGPHTPPHSVPLQRIVL